MPHDPLLDLTPGRTDGWVWVQSDLQLSQPELARRVLADAVADMQTLDLDLAAIWCLGDALCGRHVAHLEEVATASVALLETFQRPIAYLMGNHEMDLRDHGHHRWPLYELAAGRPLWHAQAHLGEPWFERRCCGQRVLFLGDHAAPGPDGTWYVQHHHIKGTGYPYTEADWAALRQRVEDSPEPVLTVSHYALPGGPRPGHLLARLLPLPATVLTHLHGHAHIGDLVWNRDRPWQRECTITGCRTLQYNISALETARSPGSHSALLRFTNGRLRTILIRCHQTHVWTESFTLPTPPPA
jgi:hypothetical protein